jgi:integrase
MKLSEQAERFIRQIANRKRAPARKATLKSFQNRLDSVILPRLGEMDLKDIENGVVRQFVADISLMLAPTTITATLSLLKAVIASAVDENGNRTYNRTWNADFIDAPLIRRTGLKAPLLPLPSLLEAITTTLRGGKGLDAAFYALMAGSGLRVGEALAVGTGHITGLNLWNPDKAVLSIRSTVLQNGEIQPMPKTEAGIREVDLHPELNSFLRRAPLKEGLLFQNDGKLLIYSSVLRRMHKLGIPEGCHAFRRFRATHLDKMNVPEGLKRFWLGHASSNISESYVKIGHDLDARKTWCKKAGLGFELNEETT